MKDDPKRSDHWILLIPAAIVDDVPALMTREFGVAPQSLQDGSELAIMTQGSTVSVIFSVYPHKEGHVGLHVSAMPDRRDRVQAFVDALVELDAELFNVLLYNAER